tara:strand:+ start:770 stop:1576 length:807 start_codon:yes stop_codon:yes gene_type:complete
MPDLNTITNNIQTSCGGHVPNISVNTHFLQTEAIPESKKRISIKMPKTTFSKNKIIEIPEFCHTFIDNNNYYLYGSPNLFYSIMFIIDENFRLGGVTKKNELDKFKEILLKNFNIIYKKFSFEYASQNIKRTKLETYIKELDFENNIMPFNGIFQLIADCKHINITILNNSKKLYDYYGSLDKSSDNIILVNLEGNLVPLLNIYGNLFSCEEITIIKTYFKRKLVINKLSSYKLCDLQLLANNNDILVKHDNKNKSKQKIYDELLALT